MAAQFQPVIYQIDDNLESLERFQAELEQNEQERELLLDFPTVYIHNWQRSRNYEVYIGESAQVVQRTRQHYEKTGDGNSWQHQLARQKARLYVIGHPHFNKSLTLDIENRLMLYLMSCGRVQRVHNLRGNPQKRYYPDHEMDEIFRRIWAKLRRFDAELFPRESQIKDSAVFKASPLHRLTSQQEALKQVIVEKVMAALGKQETGRLIFIEGEAGTGKTVLNSSAFYEMYAQAEEQGIRSLQSYLIVNHDEQITVYRQIAEKLGLTQQYGEVVYKPTQFILRHTPERPADVAFVDEAHLLLTQGKQSYTGQNQLQDILSRAKVTVVMFDENQILTTEQYWEAQILDRFRSQARNSGNYFVLSHQLRIAASPQVQSWIDRFTKERKIGKIPRDASYEIRIFDDPAGLEKAIKEKGAAPQSRLSRMVATYDWEYSSTWQIKNRLSGYWEVMIGSWHKPWNRELEKDLEGREKRKLKNLSWAEQPQTIDEIGSTFTIQGFDLNYVGVILGPSVKYRDGKIVFDASASCNHKATRRRTLSDGTKQKFGETLIQHEVRVLMTRGINGLYLYACDEALREALKKAAMQEEKI